MLQGLLETHWQEYFVSFSSIYIVYIEIWKTWNWINILHVYIILFQGLAYDTSPPVRKYKKLFYKVHEMYVLGENTK